MPPGIRCKCKLVLRKEDDGIEHNKLKTFDVIGIDPPDVDAFASADAPSPSVPLPQAGEGSIAPTAEGSAGGTDDAF